MLEEYGLAGLFAVAFAAATILPFSSEGAVAGALLLGWSPAWVLAVASAGNCLATLFNYGLGYWAAERWLHPEKMKPSTRRAFNLAHKYGSWSLLLSWLPLIGDPITIAAGVLRWRLWLFVPVVFALRVARYVAIVWALIP